MSRLNTVFGHIANAETDVCRRAKSNITNQGGSVSDFRQRCKEEGYFFVELDEDVFAIKSEEALTQFLKDNPDGTTR